MTKVNCIISFKEMKKLNFIFILILVLSIYGFKFLGYDSKMSVLCFLHISSDSIVDECFNCCEGILSTKLALYIYSLRYAFQFMSDIDFLKLSTDQVCYVQHFIYFNKYILYSITEPVFIRTSLSIAH